MIYILHVHCTVYNAYSAVYSVLFICSRHINVFKIRRKVEIDNMKVKLLNCTVYNVHCTLYSVHIAHYTHKINFIMFTTLYIFFFR